MTIGYTTQVMIKVDNEIEINDFKMILTFAFILSGAGNNQTQNFFINSHSLTLQRLFIESSPESTLDFTLVFNNFDNIAGEDINDERPNAHVTNDNNNNNKRRNHMPTILCQLFN